MRLARPLAKGNANNYTEKSKRKAIQIEGEKKKKKRKPMACTLKLNHRIKLGLP